MESNSRILIRDCYKTYRHDQDKVLTPQETIRRVKDRLASIDLKVLTETVRIDSGRLGIPVFISLCGEDATRLTGTKKQMGKGATPSQSEASAIMELVERYSFFAFMKQSAFPLLPYGAIGSDAVPVERLLLSLHDRHSSLRQCRDFLDAFPMRWVCAHNLTHHQNQWVPIDWFYLINEYNGPAAGNTLEEAILQSLCEVVERHVGSIISHQRMETPTIDPHSLRDPVAIQLVECFEKEGIRLFLKDFSLDTGIPTVGAIAYDPATFPERSEIVFTAGTTSNPEKSLCRALTEVAQLAGDFQSRTTYRPTLPKYTRLEDADYLMKPGRTVSISSLPDLQDSNLRVEIERCVSALGGIDLEVLVVNSSHPLLGIPCVYTIIPGAHFLDRTRDTDFPQHAARVLLQGASGDCVLPLMERLAGIFGPRYDLSFFVAHAFELEGQTEKALKHYQEALRQQPDPQETASIHIHIASCLKELGRYEEALEALQTAEGYNKELKEIHNLRGFCLFKLKRHEDAIAAFERAIEIDPGSAIDYANIGSNLRELGHKREAVRLYRMALELDPDIDFARENIARLEGELQGG
ncbi:MAG: tetratricopeptide repeat protein [Deltaproteobacteria bacterium]|nr:tetratricopeptide repeat protein [Deltaproteobacteria bacterium]